jgi:hypothetical protein
MILSIGDKTVFVLKIAGEPRMTGGGRLVLRSQAGELSASIAPDVTDRLPSPGSDIR